MASKARKIFNTHGSVMSVISSSIFGTSKHGSRHRRSQMKAIGRGRFTGKSSRFGL